MKPWIRHLVVLVLASVAVLLLGWLRAQWDVMHRWNRAFGDAGFVLFAITMAVGPIVVMVPRLSPLLQWRRELGIHAAVFASVHAAIVFIGWFAADLWRLSGFAFHPRLQDYVLAEHGLGLANWVGLFALIPALWLAAISNDKALGLLGPRIWKHVQSLASGIWILVLLHTGYFLLMHFQHFHRPDPPPNPVTWFLVALAVAVQGARWSATLTVWRRSKRRSPPSPAATFA